VAGKERRNRQAFHDIVVSGRKPGVLAYRGREPIGWCAVAPRADYPALARSRVLKPVDDQPVWAVSCFFVAKPYRRRGVSAALLRAAVDLAARQGAQIVEGYPVEPTMTPVPDAFVWTGTPSAFRQAGFREVLRRSPTRPIMRYTIDPAH
jgi:GNAT superfamily N-acetyltransferase